MDDIRDTWEYAFTAKVADIAIRISQRVQELGITRAELARRMDMSRPTVTQMLDGNNNFTVKTLAKLAKALGMSIEEIVSYKCPKLNEAKPPQSARLTVIAGSGQDQLQSARQ